MHKFWTERFPEDGVQHKPKTWKNKLLVLVTNSDWILQAVLPPTFNLPSDYFKLNFIAPFLMQVSLVFCSQCLHSSQIYFFIFWYLKLTFSFLPNDLLCLQFLFYPLFWETQFLSSSSLHSPACLSARCYILPCFFPLAVSSFEIRVGKMLQKEPLRKKKDLFSC